MSLLHIYSFLCVIILLNETIANYMPYLLLRNTFNWNDVHINVLKNQFLQRTRYFPFEMGKKRIQYILINTHERKKLNKICFRFRYQSQKHIQTNECNLLHNSGMEIIINKTRLVIKMNVLTYHKIVRIQRE